MRSLHYSETFRSLLSIFKKWLSQPSQLSRPLENLMNHHKILSQSSQSLLNMVFINKTTVTEVTTITIITKCDCSSTKLLSHESQPSQSLPNMLLMNKTTVTRVTAVTTIPKHDDSSQTCHHKCHKRYNDRDDSSQKRHIISQIFLSPYQEQKRHHKHYHKRHKRHKQPLRKSVDKLYSTACPYSLDMLQ